MQLSMRDTIKVAFCTLGSLTAKGASTCMRKAVRTVTDIPRFVVDDVFSLDFSPRMRTILIALLSVVSGATGLIVWWLVTDQKAAEIAALSEVPDRSADLIVLTGLPYVAGVTAYVVMPFLVAILWGVVVVVQSVIEEISVHTAAVWRKQWDECVAKVSGTAPSHD